MSVLVFVEIADGKIKKAAYEAAYYASKTAELTGTTAEAVVPVMKRLTMHLKQLN